MNASLTWKVFVNAALILWFVAFAVTPLCIGDVDARVINATTLSWRSTVPDLAYLPPRGQSPGNPGTAFSWKIADNTDPFYKFTAEGEGLTDNVSFDLYVCTRAGTVYSAYTKPSIIELMLGGKKHNVRANIGTDSTPKQLSLIIRLKCVEHDSTWPQ